MIITNIPINFKLNQENYNKLVDSIDFDSIYCASCSHHNWAFHASYSRKICILDRTVEITITRVICLSCGKTHAILVEGIVPFSLLSHSEIINILISSNTDLIDASHLFFLKLKYHNVNFHDYRNICILNRRSCSTIFSFST